MSRAQLYRRFVTARSLTGREWLDLLRACFEVARAHRLLNRIDPRSLVSTQQEFGPPDSTGLVDRVAWAVPAAASIVPWRSDCLVQALAAHRWLDTAGVQTHLHLGVARDNGFSAHAWLTCGTKVITGGDVSRFVTFERSG